MATEKDLDNSLREALENVTQLREDPARRMIMEALHDVILKYKHETKMDKMEKHAADFNLMKQLYDESKNKQKTRDIEQEKANDVLINKTSLVVDLTLEKIKVESQIQNLQNKLKLIDAKLEQAKSELAKAEEEVEKVEDDRVNDLYEFHKQFE